MSDTDKYYHVLGLNPGASEEEIKEAYRRMVKVWDADRFPNNPKMQKIVNERLKEIDEAYKNLLLSYSGYYKREKETMESQPEERGKETDSVVGVTVQQQSQELTAQEEIFSRPDVSHDLGYPPDWVDPNEPLFKSEKERPTRMSYEDYGGSQPPPKQPFAQPPPHVDAIRQEKQSISYLPLGFFFGVIGGAIGKSITNFIHFSPDEAFIYGGGIPTIFGVVGMLIAVGIMRIINGMEKPRKHKVRLAWGAVVIGGLLFPLTSWFILSHFLEHRQPRTSSSLTHSKKVDSRTDPLLADIGNEQKRETIAERYLPSLTDEQRTATGKHSWKFFGISEDGDSYYDGGSIARTPENNVRVWTKTVHTRKSVAKWVRDVGTALERLSYTLSLFELNCKDRMDRPLEGISYSKEEEVLGSVSFNDDEKWEFIPPNSLIDGLYKEVCK